MFDPAISDEAVEEPQLWSTAELGRALAAWGARATAAECQ